MKEKIKLFWEDIDNQIANGKWVLQYCRRHRHIIVKTLIIGVTSSIVGIILSLLVKELIDGATSHAFDFGNLAIYGGVLIMSELISVLWNYISIEYDEKICQETRKELLNSILHAEWTKISEYKNGDLQTRLTSDVDRLADGISDLIPSILSVILQLIMTLIVLAYYNAAIALAALVTGVVGGFLFLLLKDKIFRLQQKVQKEESINRSHMIESCSNIDFIKSFCAEEKSIDLLDKMQVSKFSAVKKLAFANNRTSFCVNLIFDLSYLLAFGLGIYFLSKDSISYGTLSLYIVLAGQVQRPIVSLAKSISQVISMLASAGRIKELTDIPAEDKHDADFPKTRYGIRIENVDFQYSSGTQKVLDNVSLTVKPGEIVGVAGRSGSGKTTLMRLILSLLSPQTGKIEFVTESGECFPVGTATRKIVGYVPQGNMIISGTVRENVLFGTQENVSDKEVIEALKLAAAYDFVSETENGLSTMIGEQGKGLSQGQAQRIAVARAFIKQAPILILDEATSALDEETENKILQSISTAHNRPTCIFVTHGKAVLKKCNRVLTVADGKIVESIPD